MTPKFYKCQECGQIIAVVQASACTPVCCGQKMQEISANTTDAAQEKHVPVISTEGNIVTVKVGSVDHPMTEAHLIEWICLVTKQGVQRKVLSAGSAPCAQFALLDGDEAVEAYAYCNLHGLWKSEA